MAGTENLSASGRVAVHTQLILKLTASLDEGTRLLLALIRDRNAIPAAETCGNLLSQARRNLLAPWLYHRLATGGGEVPEELRRGLHDDFLRSSATNTAFFHHLAPALEALGRTGIPVIVLKGAHLATAVYDSAALRPMGDIDILVRRSELSRAQQQLLAAGCRPQQGKCPIDIHWGLNLSHEDLQQDLDGMWERSIPLTVAGSRVRGLATEDLVVYLAAHLSYQHLFAAPGLRNLIDLHEIIGRERGAMNWPAVIERSRQWRNGGGAYVTLLLAKNLVGADVPEDVLAALSPSALDEDILPWAVGQMFCADFMTDEVHLSPYFWRLWSGGSLGPKLAGLRLLLAPPRVFVSQKYPVKADSPLSLLFYLKRLGEHAGDYLRATWKLMLRDKGTLARAERENRNMDMRSKLFSP